MIGRGLLGRLQSLVPGARFLHSVHHNPKKGVFYVNLDVDLDSSLSTDLLISCIFWIIDDKENFRKNMRT